MYVFLKDSSSVHVVNAAGALSETSKQKARSKLKEVVGGMSLLFDENNILTFLQAMRL